MAISTIVFSFLGDTMTLLVMGRLCDVYCDCSEYHRFHEIGDFFFAEANECDRVTKKWFHAVGQDNSAV